MSTVLVGDDDVVFDALKDILRAASRHGEAVLVVTLSNACPT